MNEETKTPEPGAVLLRRHHDITPFASTDLARHIITGVHYKASKGVMEATNGKIAVRVPVETAPDESGLAEGLQTKAAPPVDCIIPPGIFQKALANIPNGRSILEIQVARLDTSSKSGDVAAPVVTLTTSDNATTQAVKARGIEGEYPNVDVVLPTGDVVLEMALGAGLLGTLCQYAKKHGLSDPDTAIRFTVRKGNVDADGTVTGGVEFSFVLADAKPKKATGVIMPMRLS